MDLDDLNEFRRIDAQNMIGQINDLPQQLSDAWELGMSLPLPQWNGVKNIVIAGMGGSAIGADLLASYAAPACPLSIFIHRDYDLPAWAAGEQTLVILSSHSGETEETLAVFEQARARGCQALVVSTGGRLVDLAQAGGVPVWQFNHTGQPRAAVGYSFGLLLAALHRAGLLPDPYKDIHDTLHAMRNLQTNLNPEAPIAFNPAKRLAGQLVGRSVVIFAAGYLAPVARRWKSQISETAKAWAQFEVLPEADHNTLAGLNHPEAALMQMAALFLKAPTNHPRDLLRLDYTREIFTFQGINTDVVQAKGNGRMAHLWTLLHFGDYTSYYLAMAYGANPTPEDLLAVLQTELNQGV